jgi:hypothetical protein
MVGESYGGQMMVVARVLPGGYGHFGAVMAGSGLRWVWSAAASHPRVWLDTSCGGENLPKVFGPGSGGDIHGR